MKNKFLFPRISGLAFLATLGACSSADGSSINSTTASAPVTQITLGSRHKPIIKVDGLQFRDLDNDGKLAPFEDWRLAPAVRARDITARMTLEEKLGTLLHGSLPGNSGRFDNSDTGYALQAVGTAIGENHVTSFISRLTAEPAKLAEQNNAVQALAEQARLGIPVTISSDPRNHFQYVLGASEVGGGFSQWPEPLGFAALADPALVHEFADIARREYRAVGIHMTLSPQADLATEPLWPRQPGTFGSQPGLAGSLAAAYVEGFQGGKDGPGRDGVLSVIKHFAGYGAQPEGFDGHNYYGRYADLDDAEFAHHVDAFRDSLKVKVGGVMPAYPILRGPTINGQPVEQVGAGFSSLLLDTLLRDELGFDGMVVSDWAITQDCDEPCKAPTAENPQTPAHIATSWGVDHLSKAERFAIGLKAGIDQFGGVDDPAPLMEAFDRKLIDETRIDASVVRVMTSKFQLGLFENPYVSPDAAGDMLGNRQFAARAEETQRKAQVLLKNSNALLPIAADHRKVYLFGVDPLVAQRAGLIVVNRPEDADFSVIRSEAPSEMLHPHHFFGSRYKEGRLDFRPGDPAYDELLKARRYGPTILAIFLDRPAILTNVLDHSDAVLANFGASDAAVLDVILGKANAQGRLPFELPSSMAEIRNQRSGTPDDTTNPLFTRGAGILP
ncbi:glycoside hydrolase family 3 protein [Novosphingobium aerophilum]|uniref:beta-glucosidase n=1 Tax=Novosphingobium aerophilum TaxID=2839843 RepID=A0A7X1KAS1_9SPHN|nr:glycoside hydrolase family 3 N-terminal domain-containing protein [Novosphingobium aerophilum]MBC2650511.1 glycoside hydrolase family 3 C-terminal domain-containing protein [Novosphingobium aerophilum]